MQVLSNSVFIVSQRDTDDQRNTNQEKKMSNERKTWRFYEQIQNYVGLTSLDSFNFMYNKKAHMNTYYSLKTINVLKVSVVLKHDAPIGIP